MNYTGLLTNGTKFDSSLNPGRTPFRFTVGAGQVISGWDQGVPGMKVGGKKKINDTSKYGLWESRYGSYSSKFDFDF